MAPANEPQINRPYSTDFLYDAPVERVWQALTSEDQMREWYFPQLRKFEPVVGARFEFDNDGSAYQKEWTVTAVSEHRKLAHTWIYKGYPGVSEVAFELFDDDDGKTRLRLTHTGLESFPDDPHFAKENFERGWKRILGNNLKSLLNRHS